MALNNSPKENVIVRKEVTLRWEKRASREEREEAGWAGGGHRVTQGVREPREELRCSVPECRDGLWAPLTRTQTCSVRCWRL